MLCQPISQNVKNVKTNQPVQQYVKSNIDPPTQQSPSEQRDSKMSSESNLSAHVNAVTDTSSHVLFQVARVSAFGKCGNTKAVILVDTGSDKTYVSQQLIDKIGPEWLSSHNLTYGSFGTTHVSRAEHRDVYSINLQGSQGNATLLATGIPNICTPVGKAVRVDILIRLDTYWKLLSSDIISKPSGLVAQKCIFGWILSDPLPSPMLQLCQFSYYATDLEKIGDLESVGIRPHETLDVHDPVLAEFTNSIQFSNGR